MKRVILFDGECNFCDHSVQFIIKRDPQAVFHFASLQSEAGHELLKGFDVPQGLDSFVLLEGDRFYAKSSAALRVCKHLRGGWKLFYVFLILPSPLRDFFYNIVAKNRYKWFGKKDSCMLPSADVRKRFL